jgi:hypothetical protein
MAGRVVWRIVAVPLVGLVLAGCGGEKEPKLKEPIGGPRLEPMKPGSPSQPGAKGFRK